MWSFLPTFGEDLGFYYCSWPLDDTRALSGCSDETDDANDLLPSLICVFFSGTRLLQPAQVCDVLKGFIMVICYSMMSYVDYAMMYHLIRGQSVIKLYIIYNMLEVQPDHSVFVTLVIVSHPLLSFPCCVVRWRTACSHHLARISWTRCTGQPPNPKRRREHT